MLSWLALLLYLTALRAVRLHLAQGPVGRLWGIGAGLATVALTFCPTWLPAWLGGLGAVTAAALLAQPRHPAGTWLLLLALIGGLGIFHPILTLLPFFVGLGLLAIWPREALWLAVTGSLLAVGLGLQGWLPPLPLPAPGTLGGALLVGATVLALQLYHWRWWPLERQLALGLGTPALLLAPATGTLTPLLAATPLILLALLKLWAARHPAKVLGRLAPSRRLG